MWPASFPGLRGALSGMRLHVAPEGLDSFLLSGLFSSSAAVLGPLGVRAGVLNDLPISLLSVCRHTYIPHWLYCCRQLVRRVPCRLMWNSWTLLGKGCCYKLKHKGYFSVGDQTSPFYSLQTVLAAFTMHSEVSLSRRSPGMTFFLTFGIACR